MANDLQSELNDWFLSLPEARRVALLNGDRWMLAGAAFQAGKESPTAPPDRDAMGRLIGEASGGEAVAWEYRVTAGPATGWSPWFSGDGKRYEKSYQVERRTAAREQGALTGAEIDTLVALVERGPLSDGDVSSKSGRDSLVARGLAARILVHGQDGYQAATHAGRDAYQGHFGGADTTEGATANRITTRTLRNARKDAQ